MSSAPRPVYDSLHALLGDGGKELARRRFQQKGDLVDEGGWWKLRWKVDQRQPDGTVKRGWSSRVVVGPSKSNEAMDGWGVRRARKEAYERFLSRLNQNATPQAAVTFAEFVERKYRPEHLNHLEWNTRTGYESALRRYILPELGPKRLSEIRRDDVQRVVQRIEGLRMAYLTLAVVSGVFHLAEDAEWVVGNPARRVRLPKYKADERAALTWDQVSLLAAAMDPRYRSLLLVMALTGMRPAEAAGLRWRNVDLEGPKFIIRIVETFTNSRWKATPKNDNSEREIPMVVDVWMILSEIRGTSKFTAPGHPVFANTKGKPLHMGNLNKRYLKAAAKEIGMPGLTWYNLRHTASTRADQVMTVAEKAKLFGHEPQMNRRYTHPELQALREQMEKAGPKETVN